MINLQHYVTVPGNICFQLIMLAQQIPFEQNNLAKLRKRYGMEFIFLCFKVFDNMHC
jgi:hypothetical protein